MSPTPGTHHVNLQFCKKLETKAAGLACTRDNRKIVEFGRPPARSIHHAVIDPIQRIQDGFLH